MALKQYMDHHVPRAITIGLRMRNVDVITALKMLPAAYRIPLYWIGLVN